MIELSVAALIAEDAKMDTEGSVTGQEMNSNPTLTESPATSSNTPTSDERVFRQNEVNDIVKRVKHEAIESYKKIASAQPEYAQQKYGATEQRPTNTQNAYQQMPESDIRKMAAEEATRLRDEWMNDAQSRNEQEQAKRIVDSFWTKVNAGKEKYSDFETVTGNIELRSFPNVVQLLAEHIDNSSDLLYELGKDRLKMAQLEQLSWMSPNDAVVQAKRMAQSIKDNEQAGKARSPNQPLSQMRPATVGTETGGVLSVSDYRRKYKV